MNKVNLDADFAITLRPEETKDITALGRSSYLWSGWKKHRWPAYIARPGLQIYGFDTKLHQLCVLLEITKGGSFSYRTRKEFSTKVQKITGWVPDTDDPHWKKLPIAKQGKPCTGIAIRWKVIKPVAISWPHRFSQLGWEKLASSNAPTNSRCWIIKTTEGGPGNIDHWLNFQEEKVVAVGWRIVKYDPMQFKSREEYRKLMNSNFVDWNVRHAASTIYNFAHEWQVGDTAIICTGYAPNQTKDVYLYGVAKIGRYFYDKSSLWWRFKRQAEITLIEQKVPISIFKKYLGGSSRQTIHGPFTQKEFKAFYKEIGIRFEATRKSIKLLPRSNDVMSLPEEVKNVAKLPEGAVKQILVNAYERNPKARRQCIAHYGTTCYVCDFDFLEHYGKMGAGFIQVHHLKQLSEVGKRYKVDPIAHLRPVCPNCHAIIHRHKRAYSIKEVKSFIRRQTDF